MSPSAMLATQGEGGCRQAPATQTAAASTASTGTPARHQSLPSAISATPATQNAHRCCKAPRLPRRMHLRRRQEPRATQTAAASTASIGTQARDQPAHWHKCTCHAECTSMSPSATPATQSEGRCRLAKCYACHAK